MKKILEFMFGWLFGNKGTNLINPFGATGDVLGNNVLGDDGVLGSFSEQLFGDDFQSLIHALVNRVSAQHLTGAENEANTWSAGQAQLARDYQEYFYNSYQSPQAQVQQFQQAGLNPALMYGQMQSSAPVSSNAPSSVSPQGSQLGLMDIVSSLANLRMRMSEMKADIALKNANARKMNVETDYIAKNFELQSQRLQMDREMQTKNIENIDSEIAYRASRKLLTMANIDKTVAETALTNYQADIAQIDSRYRSKLHQSLLDLQEVSRQKSIAETKLTYSTDDIKRQEYKEMLDSYEDRMNKIAGDAFQAMADAGIKGNELEYWKDFKHLEAVAIQAGVIRDTKGNFFGVSYNNSPLLRELGAKNDFLNYENMSPFAPADVDSFSSDSVLNSLDTFGSFSDKINKRKGWTKRVDSWREKNFNVGSGSHRSYWRHR